MERDVGELEDQTHTQLSFDSRLICRVLYSHFTHIYLSRNTRPINVSLAIYHDFKSQIQANHIPKNCRL